MKASNLQKKTYAQALKGGSSSQPYINNPERELPEECISPFDQDGKASCKSVDFALAKLHSCSGYIDEEALHKLDRCLFGTAHDYFETCTIMENFRMSGVSGISAKKISGRQFLIEFEDDDVRENMELQNWVWLKEWFF
ncbi:hypothetical protein REPUB_Repub16aG0137400 [Reevesia pubescens]